MRIVDLVMHPSVGWSYVKREWRYARGRARFARNRPLWARREELRYQDAFPGDSLLISRAQSLAAHMATVLLEVNGSPDIQEIRSHADKLLDGSVYVLYDYREGVLEDGRPRWGVDYATGARYTAAHFSRARGAVEPGKKADIKRVWEVARMEYLLAPALMYHLTREERYAGVVVDILGSFIESVPYDVGPQWQPSFEVGIRLINMIAAFSFVVDAEVCDEEFVDRFLRSAKQHCHHILQFEENISGLTSTHYLGGLVGLAAFCALADESQESLRRYVQRALEEESRRQILDAGCDYEGSTSYQRLAGELLGYSAAMLEFCGIKLSRGFHDRLASMARYSTTLRRSNGTAVQIGDNDSGRVLRLLPDGPNDHAVFLRLASRSGEGFCDVCAEGEERILETPRMMVVSRAGMHLTMTAFDAGEFGMGGHTHNDLLSFTLFVDGRDFIVDPGTGSYTGDALLRNEMRSTFSHATIAVEGLEQREIGPDPFGWADSVVTHLSMERNDGEIRISGWHDGYQKRLACRHERDCAIWSKRGRITIVDRIVGADQPMTCTLPLHPDVEVRDGDDGRILLVNEGVAVEVSGSWSFRIEKARYSSHYDCVVESRKLVAEAQTNPQTLELRVIR